LQSATLRAVGSARLLSRGIPGRRSGVGGSIRGICVSYGYCDTRPSFESFAKLPERRDSARSFSCCSTRLALSAEARTFRERATVSSKRHSTPLTDCSTGERQRKCRVYPVRSPVFENAITSAESARAQAENARLDGQFADCQLSGRNFISSQQWQIPR